MVQPWLKASPLPYALLLTYVIFANIKINTKMKKSLLLLFTVLFLTSCVEQDNPPEPLFGFSKGEGFFILNEGGFTKGNASVSYKFEGQDSIIYDLYATVQGEKLGDVLQSAVLHEGQLYLVVNNSAYIKVVDVQTFEEKGEIRGFSSPRYMQLINESEAYVSDQYANKIWKVDLNDLSITDSIEVSGWTEEMVLVDNRVYVTSPSVYGQEASKHVYVIDTDKDELVESLEVGNNPVNIIADDRGWIHVFNQGDPFGDPVVKPSFFSFNSANHEESRLKNIPNLPVAYHSKMRLSPDQESIYLLYGGLYEVDNLDIGLSYTSIPLIEAEGRSLYGLEVHPSTGNLFISDVLDYNQNGSFYEYQTNAIEVDDFSAGIIPNGIIWY
jgi:hypothetical protein